VTIPTVGLIALGALAYKAATAPAAPAPAAPAPAPAPKPEPEFDLQQFAAQHGPGLLELAVNLSNAWARSQGGAAPAGNQSVGSVAAAPNAPSIGGGAAKF
jgi:hypothetical protein